MWLRRIVINFLRILLSISLLISSSWEADKEKTTTKNAQNCSYKGLQIRTRSWTQPERQHKTSLWFSSQIGVEWNDLGAPWCWYLKTASNLLNTAFVLEELYSPILWSLNPLWNERFSFMMIVLRTSIFNTLTRRQFCVLKQSARRK